MEHIVIGLHNAVGSIINATALRKQLNINSSLSKNSSNLSFAPSSSGGGGGKAASVSPSGLASTAVSSPAAFVSPGAAAAAAAGALASCFAGSGSVAGVSSSSNPHGSSSSAISKYKFMQTYVIVIRNHFHNQGYTLAPLASFLYLQREISLKSTSETDGFNNNKSSSSSSSLLHLKLTVFFFGNIGAVSSSKKWVFI
uniref:Uncharacterized protein n=1 Tax=Glossina austeni TaxID=7395 RepID=A0A1A9VED2_GLOAU